MFLFISFFPQLIAGPIVRYSHMINQFEDQNNSSVLEEADAQFEIDNEHVENHEQDEGDLSNLGDKFIFEPKRKEDNKEDQDA